MEGGDWIDGLEGVAKTVVSGYEIAVPIDNKSAATLVADESMN